MAILRYWSRIKIMEILLALIVVVVVTSLFVILLGHDKIMADIAKRRHSWCTARSLAAQGVWRRYRVESVGFRYQLTTPRACFAALEAVIFANRYIFSYKLKVYQAARSQVSDLPKSERKHARKLLKAFEDSHFTF